MSSPATGARRWPQQRVNNTPVTKHASASSPAQWPRGSVRREPVRATHPRDDQPRRVDHLSTGQPSVGNDGDPSVAHANVAHPIETRFRVDDAPAVNDEVNSTEPSAAGTAGPGPSSCSATASKVRMAVTTPSASENSPPRQRRGYGEYGGAGVSEQEPKGSRVGSPQSHRERREGGRRTGADQADPSGCIAVEDRA